MNTDLSTLRFIDKPKGITSHNVIRKLKKEYPKGTKLGHAGTLDPNATGLMIVGVDAGTKLLRHFLGSDKEYVAEIMLGTKTDSGDSTGVIVETSTPKPHTGEEIQKVLDDMIGPLRLSVSKFSAKKIGGKRAYELARRGVDMPTILQDMDVREAELLETHSVSENPKLTVRFVVSSGSYIRSIAEELAKRLGTIGTLTELRRTKIGDITIDQAEML